MPSITVSSSASMQWPVVSAPSSVQSRAFGFMTATERSKYLTGIQHLQALRSFCVACASVQVARNPMVTHTAKHKREQLDGRTGFPAGHAATDLTLSHQAAPAAGTWPSAADFPKQVAVGPAAEQHHNRLQVSLVIVHGGACYASCTAAA